MEMPSLLPMSQGQSRFRPQVFFGAFMGWVGPGMAQKETGQQASPEVFSKSQFSCRTS